MIACNKSFRCNHFDQPSLYLIVTDGWTLGEEREGMEGGEDVRRDGEEEIKR